MFDQIILDGMQVMSRVGVPLRERARAQMLEISVTLDLDLKRAAVSEEIDQTVDYACVHSRVMDVARQRPRPLIETVAEDVARMLLREFKVRRVGVEVRKFILPKTRSVAVRIVRKRG